MPVYETPEFRCSRAKNSTPQHTPIYLKGYCFLVFLSRETALIPGSTRHFWQMYPSFLIFSFLCCEMVQQIFFPQGKNIRFSPEIQQKSPIQEKGCLPAGISKVHKGYQYSLFLSCRPTKSKKDAGPRACISLLRIYYFAVVE